MERERKTGTHREQRKPQYCATVLSPTSTVPVFCIYMTRDRQADTQRDRQADRYTDRQVGRHTSRQTDTKTNRQADRQIDRLTQPDK